MVKKVELDKPIADDIVEINKKGYKTEYCCAGHLRKIKDYKAISFFYVSINVSRSKNIEKLIRNKPRHLDYEVNNQLDLKVYIKDDGILYSKMKDDIFLIIRPSKTAFHKNKSSKKLYKKINMLAREEFHELVESL